MTRFRLRERLKRRMERCLGHEKEEVEPIWVEFVLPDGSERRVRTEPHYTLVMASQLLETPIHTSCPDGHCGQCQVEILQGADALRPPSEAETGLLEEHLGQERDPSVRLACHARLLRTGARVKVRRVWRLEDVGGRGE